MCDHDTGTRRHRLTVSRSAKVGFPGTYSSEDAMIVVSTEVHCLDAGCVSELKNEIESEGLALVMDALVGKTDEVLAKRLLDIKARHGLDPTLEELPPQRQRSQQPLPTAPKAKATAKAAPKTPAKPRPKAGPAEDDGTEGTRELREEIREIAGSDKGKANLIRALLLKLKLRPSGLDELTNAQQLWILGKVGRPSKGFESGQIVAKRNGAMPPAPISDPDDPDHDASQEVARASAITMTNPEAEPAKADATIYREELETKTRPELYNLPETKGMNRYLTRADLINDLVVEKFGVPAFPHDIDEIEEETGAVSTEELPPSPEAPSTAESAGTVPIEDVKAYRYALMTASMAEVRTEIDEAGLTRRREKQRMVDELILHRFGDLTPVNAPEEPEPEAAPAAHPGQTRYDNDGPTPEPENTWEIAASVAWDRATEEQRRILYIRARPNISERYVKQESRRDWLRLNKASRAFLLELKDWAGIRDEPAAHDHVWFLPSPGAKKARCTATRCAATAEREAVRESDAAIMGELAEEDREALREQVHGFLSLYKANGGDPHEAVEPLMAEFPRFDEEQAAAIIAEWLQGYYVEAKAVREGEDPRKTRAAERGQGISDVDIPTVPPGATRWTVRTLRVLSREQLASIELAGYTDGKGKGLIIRAILAAQRGA